jgi:TolB-like protein/Tfp pilus assembly protein PilF
MAAIDSRPSIAVLPFENRSRDPDDAFFVEGIHDDILSQLSKVGGLRVISRTSVEQFRDTKVPMKAIADQLRVTKILEGGVQRAGDRVRIQVQLIDASSDAHLWAESYDRELTATNIFAIQSELAAAIAGALKATLTPEEQARVKVVSTQNLEAWEAYQLGKQRMARRTSAGLVNAEHYFRKALDLDPKFALAHVGLADTLILQIEYNGAPEKTARDNARNAVGEALKLDPNLAEAWASSAEILNDGRQNDYVESMFRRAIGLNPNYAQARHWYSWFLTKTGRYDEALVQIQRAVELDPLSTASHETVGVVLEGLGRFHEAEAAYRKVVTINPSNPGGYADLALLNGYARNRFTEAVPLTEKAIELDPNNPSAFTILAQLYLDLGEDHEAFKTVAHAAKRWPDASSVQVTSASVGLFQPHSVKVLHDAQRRIDTYPRSPWALTILRNADLQKNRYDAAIQRYQRSYPELLMRGAPRVDRSNYGASFDLALVLQRRGDNEQAKALLDGAARVIQSVPRLGWDGYGIADVQIQALRGQRATALMALREAEQAGWRLGWRYYRDLDPNLDAIRKEPEFRTVFADIERDMARQRAELAARPKDARLDFAHSHSVQSPTPSSDSRP